MSQPLPDRCSRQCRSCPEMVRSGCSQWLHHRYAGRLADLEDCRACLGKRCRGGMGRA
ncbi:MAG: hypothetical protein GKC10_02995 [Methanosarcinales archaeon]|nr:hypothetical protein [Methanosarcinales archaeon]